jgi:hypothetical protein
MKNEKARGEDRLEDSRLTLYALVDSYVYKTIRNLEYEVIVRENS